MSNIDGFELMCQGAEARLYCGTFHGRPCVIKERFAKQYRHPELDKELTVRRTKAEVKGLGRAKALGIRTPDVFLVNSDAHQIFMEHVDGAVSVREHISHLLGEPHVVTDEAVSSDPKIDALFKEIGSVLAVLHRNNIIHGDLTTSNILIRPKSELQMDVSVSEESGEPPAKAPSVPCYPYEIILIDFGLSVVHQVFEDKAVDLYVLERSVISTHPRLAPKFSTLTDEYRRVYGDKGEKVIEKLDEVRMRGRKRDMTG